MGLRARFQAGKNVPARAGAALVAGTFVKISATKDADGNYMVATCGLGDRCFGVTEEDVTTAQLAQSAHSVEQIVNVVRKGAIARVVPGANVNHGDAIIANASGKAIPLAAAVAASLDTGVVGSNNAVHWTARTPGAGGNSVTVTIVDPGGTTAALSVDVAENGLDITVSLARASSAITTTAQQLMDAIEANGDANSLVAVANKSTSNGTGIVAAVAKTNLATGTDPEGGGHINGYACHDALSSDDFVEVELT